MQMYACVGLITITSKILRMVGGGLLLSNSELGRDSVYCINYGTDGGYKQLLHRRD